MQIITSKHGRKLIRNGEAYRVKIVHDPALNGRYQVVFSKRQNKLVCFFLT